MKWAAIKGLVGAVAPTIGAAIGGPVGGGAGKILLYSLVATSVWLRYFQISKMKQ